MKCVFADSTFYDQPCEGQLMEGRHLPHASYYACEKHAKANKQVSPFNGVDYIKLSPRRRRILEQKEELRRRAFGKD